MTGKKATIEGKLALANTNPENTIIGVGIDTGGTSTDVVLLSMSHASVLGGPKAPTTQENQAKGYPACPKAIVL